MTRAMRSLLNRCARAVTNVRATAKNQNTVRALVSRGLVTRRTSQRRSVLVLTMAGVVEWARLADAAEKEKGRKNVRR